MSPLRAVAIRPSRPLWVRQERRYLEVSIEINEKVFFALNSVDI